MITLPCNFNMQKALFMMMLSLTATTSAAEEDLSFPFTPNSAQYWQYVSDRTMDGILPCTLKT